MAYIDKIKIGNETHTLALTPSKGSTTQPVYFDANGLPQACTSLSLNTSGNAATASSVAWGNITGKPSTFPPSGHNHTSLTNVTSLNFATHSDDGASISSTTSSATSYLDFNMSDDGGSDSFRWRFNRWDNGSGGATGYFDLMTLTTASVSSNNAQLTVNGNITANNFNGIATKAYQDQNGYNINDCYDKRYQQTVDLTGLNANTWYPVCSWIPAGGFHRVACTCHLNTGSVPPWSTHQAGFTAVVELLVTACGWGTTGGYSILLMDDQRFISGSAPVGFNQFTNSSNACFYCRGGGRYILQTDFIASWTVYSSSTTLSSETVAPKTAYPGINIAKTRIYANLSGDSIYGAVWNDYAEYRNQQETVKPGYCVASADDGKVYKTTEKFQACDGIVSDTFGFAIGETDECKTPLAVAGRVLAYCEGDRNNYHAGDTVCAGPDGKIVKMTREEIREWPDRIVGVVSEIPEYETWGTGNVEVDGRIWIKIK